MKSTWIEKLIEKEGGIVRLVTGTEQGECFWCFLKLFPESYTEYKMRLKIGRMNLKDYGEVILSGWGDKPPRVACKIMKKKYNVIVPNEYL